MINVETLKQEDVRLVTALRPEGWYDIRPVFEHYVQQPFCHPIKICMDNTIVGIGAAIIHEKIAWLGHIIVHPEFRNRGLGKTITRALVDLSYDKNCETIFLIATELGAIIYHQLGFITETAYAFYKNFDPKKQWATSEHIIPFDPNYREQVLTMDRLVSKEDRAFSLEPFMEQGFLYVENHLLKGYYLPNFGEGLIVATDQSAGIELMKFRFNTCENVVFPVDNLAATQFMEQSGYQPFKTAKRMYLGKPQPVLFANIFNRIGGNLG